MLRTVSLPKEPDRGNLYLSSMPGRFEALEVFFKEIAEAGVGHVACLVSDEEIARKSPDYLAAIRRDELPAKLWRYDIPDYGLPETPDTLFQTLDLIRSRLDAGESVVIHCAAGHGRTGLFSTLLLTRMGMPLDHAIETISLAGSAPDTQAQRDFLQSHALP
jgi:protein-tyrosine phosphatase